MSFGSTLCDKTSPPEVYTRVDHYIDWIASKMNY